MSIKTTPGAIPSVDELTAINTADVHPQLQTTNRNGSVLTGTFKKYLPESDQIMISCTSIVMVGENGKVHLITGDDTRPRSEFVYATAA
ncbi:hypothetical protein KA478_05065 [Patescibacteria group bacterium]|nr:hypothetical protein [Patescibacteria group bacterium]